MHKEKKYSAIILFTVLLFSLVIPVLVNLAKANPMGLLWYPTEPVTDPPIVTIQSPLQNKTVKSTALNFTVTKPSTWFTKAIDGYMPERTLVVGRLVSYFYVLDGNESQSVPIEDDFHYIDPPDEVVDSRNFSVDLALAEGSLVS